MRIGGAFNFPGTPLVIPLGGGGIFVPPPGNYLVSLGLVTVLQYFDPILLEWRIVSQPTMDATPISTDGAQWRLVNQSGVLVDINITNAGSGATNGIGSAATGVSIGFGTAPNPGWAPIAAPIVGGALAGLTITNAGPTGNFTVAPLVIIDPPPAGGIQATAVAQINATGQLSAVTLVQAGAGYTSVPNVYLVPQPAIPNTMFNLGIGVVNNPLNTPYTQLILQTGLPPSATGALVTCTGLTGSGTLTGAIITNYGSGFSTGNIPTVTITGCGAAAATAVMSLSMTGISGLVGGAGYGSSTGPNFETSLGFLKGTKNNGIYLPRCARGRTTVSGGGAVTGVTIEDPGFGFQAAPVLEFINTVAIATTIAQASVVAGGINDTSILQPAVQ